MTAKSVLMRSQGLRLMMRALTPPPCYVSVDCIRSILPDNGYPENIINFSISKKITQFQEQPEEGPQKCHVYLRLPWIGNVSLKFEKQTKCAIKKC